MTDASTPRRGRPPKQVRRRANLTLRIRDEIKKQLEAEAGRNSRSVSEEAESRLEQSFSNETALQSAYGPKTPALVALLTRILIDVGPIAAFQKTNDYQEAVNWLSNAYAFDQVTQAIRFSLDALRPTGGDSSPPSEDAAQLGEKMARGALVAIKDRAAGGELGDWARPVRDRLGEIVDRIRVDPREGMMINALPLGSYQGEYSRIIDTHLGRSLLPKDGETK